MKADERHRLEQNSLNRGLSTLAEKARSGEYLNSKTYVILGVVVLVVGLIGYWVYATREHDRATAKMWTELESASGGPSLEEVAKSLPDRLPGRIARLQLARVWLGPEGLQRLTSRDPETRRKAIESIEKAREAFLKLADEFKDDLTLQAQSVDGAAHAELALVGIPKDGKIDEFRGSVERAADLFNRYAAVVGESTKPGEAAKKKAEELTAKKQEVLTVAQALNNRLTPPAGPGIELPKGPLDSKLGPLGPPSGGLKAPDLGSPGTGTTIPPPKPADTKAPTPPATNPPPPAAPATPPANTTKK